MERKNIPRSIALFVTSHGFGHASRACAVAERLSRATPGLRFEIFSTVPEWFFSHTLDNFGHHSLDCDIGLVQRDALSTDFPATLKTLSREIPFQAERIKTVADTLIRLGCDLVISDIAPFGIVAAKKAGLPSVLIENFTWDWIYRSFADQHPKFLHYAQSLECIFSSADLRIQSAPLCWPVASAVRVNPIARSPRQSADTTRTALGLKEDRPLVLITMGGVPQGYPFTSRLEQGFPGVDFVISGASKQKHRTAQNITLLPADSVHYHPDLVNTADVVIGKAGYSTIAEVYHSGVPFGYFVREDYPEMPALVNFLQNETDGIALSATDYASGGWLSHLPDLLSVKRTSRDGVLNGAIECAQAISQLLANRAS